MCNVQLTHQLFTTSGNQTALLVLFSHAGCLLLLFCPRSRNSEKMAISVTLPKSCHQGIGYLIFPGCESPNWILKLFFDRKGGSVMGTPEGEVVRFSFYEAVAMAMGKVQVEPKAYAD